jgi:uncharacterized membrane protein
MTLEPLLHAPLPIRIHVATVIPAALIGAWLIMASRKGAPGHRAAGGVYLALMTVTAIDSFFIHAVAPHAPLGLSPIHILSALTLAGVATALVAARRHDVATHRRAMIGVYVGGVLIAGALTFLPGRIMHAVVFGG